MYDSDEVRDAVRRDMVRAGRIYGAMDGTTSIEWAALREADEAMQAERWAALQEAVQAFAEALREAAEAIGRALVDGLVEAMKPAIAAIKELAEQLGILSDSKTRPPWARRPRKPEVYPVRPIDAVAAGRHPAMIMRTRIRGGRR